jgi:hypothetical protein
LLAYLIDKLPPGTAKTGCYLCSNQLLTPPVFDTRIEIDFEGRVVVCRDCVAHMAGQLGWIAPEKAEELRAKNRELGRLNKAHANKLLAAEAVIAAVEAFNGVSA